MNGGIILAGREPGFEEQIRRAFKGELNGDLSVWEERLDLAEPVKSVDAIAARAPDLVAIGPGLQFDEWVALAETFDRRHPEVSLLLVAEPSPRLWEAAMHAGIRDVVSPRAEEAELRAAFERARGTAVRRKVNLLGDEAGVVHGQVIVALGPKGGVGKTTIATNLAVGLASEAPREVVLVDLDVRFGDVGSALRMEPDRTISDALKAGAEADVTSLKAFLTPHSSGLYVLCAPDSPIEADEMDAERVALIVRALGKAFRYVVVDTGAGLDEFSLAAIESATDFVLVGVPDVPSIRSMRRETAILDGLGMTAQSRHFVVNRAADDVGLDDHDIENSVGMPIRVTIPASDTVTEAMNTGTPLLLGDEDSDTVDALLDLVARFASVSDDEGRRKGGSR